MTVSILAAIVPPAQWTKVHHAVVRHLGARRRNAPRAMIRAHLLRWRPRPPCHVTRETIGPTNFRLRGPDMAPHSPYASTPRVACHHGPIK